MKRKIHRTERKLDISLDEAFNDFIAEKESINLADNTIINYRTTYEYMKNVLGFKGDEPTTFITVETVRDFVRGLKKKDNRVSSINHYLRDIRTFFYWCMDKERTYIDPDFKIKLLEGQEETFKIFSPEELKKLLVEPTNDRSDDFVEWRTWAISKYVMATGDRAGSICSIKLKDVDFDNSQIVIPHTKNKKIHITVISPSLEPALKRYIKMFLNNEPNTQYLFPNVGGNRLTTNALRLSFAKYCRERGVEKTSIHALRHTFATNWAITDGNPLKLQKALGHSTLTMTKKYIEMSVNDLKEDYEQHSLLDQMSRGKSRTKKIGKQN